MHKRKSPTERKFDFEDNIYYGYFIISDSSTIHGIHDMTTSRYPKMIKVKCKNIQSQIFNNIQSKDLAIFTPNFDFDNKNNSIFTNLKIWNIVCFKIVF